MAKYPIRLKQVTYDAGKPAVRVSGSQVTLFFFYCPLQPSFRTEPIRADG